MCGARRDFGWRTHAEIFARGCETVIGGIFENDQDPLDGILSRRSQAYWAA